MFGTYVFREKPYGNNMIFTICVLEHYALGAFFKKSGLDLFSINLEIGHLINVRKVKKKVKA
jgi:hypothetical protein